jgi:hypothetical protein
MTDNVNVNNNNQTSASSNLFINQPNPNSDHDETQTKNPSTSTNNSNTNTNTNDDQEPEPEQKTNKNNTNTNTNSNSNSNSNYLSTGTNTSKKHNDILLSPRHKTLEKLEVGQLNHHEIINFFMKEKEIIKNCEPVSWSNCDATTFQVRRGPNYVAGQKAPSQSAIYEAFALDAYSVSNKINLLSRFQNIDPHILAYQQSNNYYYDRELFPLPPVM